jgi:signal peptidase I
MRHGRLHGWAGNVGGLLLLAGWYVTLGPTLVGGPAAYVVVSGHSMDGTYETGDLIITRQQSSYEVGDIVTFTLDNGGQVIHRIIGGNGTRGYVMQGDNNPNPDPWRPSDEEIVGKSWVRLAGKAYWLELPREPWFAGSVAGILALIALMSGERSKRSRRASAPASQGNLVNEPASREHRDK